MDDGDQRRQLISLPASAINRPTRPSRVVLVATSDTLTGHAPRSSWQDATSARGLSGGDWARGTRKEASGLQVWSIN